MIYRQLNLFTDIIPSGTLTMLGVHTYLGGMQYGIQARTGRTKVLGSWESWSKGMEAREAANAFVGDARRLNVDRAPRKVDIVFANPPCSRFSLTAQWTFAQEDKDDIHNFSELMDVFNMAYNTDARCIWWETGPLAFMHGDELLRSCHQLLKEDIWKGSDVTTIMVKMDLRYLGVPQRRPRCHVIHIRDAGRPAAVREHRESAWPPKITAYEWLQNRLMAYGCKTKTPAGLDDSFGKVSPLEISKVQRLAGTIQHTMPQVLTLHDWFLPAVLSGRPAVWEELDEWVTLEEWSAAMSIPPAMALAVSKAVGVLETVTYLSKGVSPSASGFIFDDVVEPLFKLGQLPDHAEEWDQDMYKMSYLVNDNDPPRQPTKKSRRGRKPKSEDGSGE